MEGTISMCEQAKCAWWNAYNQECPEIGECAIFGIAKNLDKFRISGLPVNNNY